MPCIIILESKNTPKVRDFAREAGQIMQMKGYQMIGERPVTYFNPAVTIAPAEITSAIKMLKAIPTYSQVIKKIIHSNTFKQG